MTLGLVNPGRCSAADLAHWRVLRAKDRLYAKQRDHLARVAQARRAVEHFLASGMPCYAGVSWGKDSTVLAHLVAGTGIPLVWVRVEPLYNPDCLLVRDEFLRQHPGAVYHEVVVNAERGPDGLWAGTGRLEEGFRQAQSRFGARYLSGVRGQESLARRARMNILGIESKNTCVPLGHWTAADVYAYLCVNDLPVHTAYGCTMGGKLDRDWLRVATLGGERGTEQGRRSWEFHYYPEDMRRIFSGYDHVSGR